MNIAFAIPGFRVDSRSAEGRAVRRVVDACASRVGSAKFHPGAVVFKIDRAFNGRASDEQNAIALETLLAALCALNRIWLDYHPHTPMLEQTNVYYARTLVWDTIPALFGRGFGDCKSLTACEVAEFRRAGVWCRPVFRFQGPPNATMFHILLMFQDASWKDPSAERGMHAYQEQATPRY
jgi:hypothetical protein